MVKIAIEGLHVSLGRKPVLHGVDAQMYGGVVIGVIGPNGAGKSTLVRAMLGLIPVTAGKVLIDGVADMPRNRMARTVAYLPQGQTLHWPLTVERLVALGRLPHLAPFSRIADADHDAIERAMVMADVAGLRDRIATELSGGERARVMLARALAVEAPALVVDEPLASLDPGHQLEVMELLKAQAARGALVIAVLHDLTMAARFCDRLILLSQGRVAAEGSPSAVLTPDRLARIYGITAWFGTGENASVIVPLHRSS
ncbi:ABC transporter ATP-binding protein [Sphingobium boeckii]|uniref:Iron complex transport system ATP-binding protein n=1 Tax=Sphingobium boeckii TaxID=1082345 RepID=A0A7W9AIV8_9SPHN|nr:ABC transporter ATP-binding protein [Sphingobium boeckii]MBB5686497.1 iron complex transport system ATP-binding protein [Sphingobium boeckii]